MAAEEDPDMENDTDNETAFRDWLRAVSALCVGKFGLTLRDLPDMLTRDAFDEGVTPAEFFEDDVMRVMREDFGALVDDIE